jgi:hypothetical protein
LAPFAKPLVLDCPDSSQGRVSYLPIPFAQGCKIRSDTRLFYWQINALLYEDADVETFVPALSEAALSHLACQGSKGRDFSSLFARRHGDELAVAFPCPTPTVLG